MLRPSLPSFSHISEKSEVVDIGNININIHSRSNFNISSNCTSKTSSMLLSLPLSSSKGHSTLSGGGKIPSFGDLEAGLKKRRFQEQKSLQDQLHCAMILSEGFTIEPPSPSSEIYLSRPRYHHHQNLKANYNTVQSPHNYQPSLFNPTALPIMPIMQNRACTQCGIYRTPNWRTCLFTRRTLCNACGLAQRSQFRKYYLKR